jgi:hypothetical protein
MASDRLPAIGIFAIGIFMSATTLLGGSSIAGIVDASSRRNSRPQITASSLTTPPPVCLGI